MRSQSLIVATLLAAVSGSAMAADLRRPAPVYTKAPPPIVYNWTGCYVGGHVGGAWSSDHFTLDNGAGIVESFSYDPSSWIGGGQLGCQLQSNNLVIGVEGTWSGLNLDQTDVSVLSPPRRRTFKLDEIATVTGRLGYAWDQWMIYGKAGWADARIDTFAINPLTSVNIDLNSWQSGFTVGGGIEWMPWQNLVLGAEFNYYNFTFDRSGIASDGTISHFFNTNANVYSAVVRASWLFNWSGPVTARY